MRSLLLFLVFGISLYSVKAQSEKESAFTHQGYLKDLRIYFISPDSGGTNLQHNFLHHRSNLGWQGKGGWSARAEIRNRLFYGEFTRISGRSLERQLNQDAGLLDLSFNPWVRRNAIFNTTIDRAYAEWSNEQWSIRAGRQRINWGVNLVWNPNDLFNVLNYADFDYEERPGSDAVRIIRNGKNMQQTELVQAFATNDSTWMSHSTTAFMHKFNTRGYDIQVLAAKNARDAVIGAGWAGNIRSAGFKGEFSLFRGLDSFSQNKTGGLVSLSADYAFLSGLYAQVSVLYNSYGESRLNLNNFSAASANGRLAVKQLMPNKLSFFTQASYAINPLLRVDFSAILASDMQTVFLLPSVSYSLREDLDLLLVDQSFFTWEDGPFEDLGHSLFLRLKWSF